MIDVIVSVISAIALGCLLFWAFRPAARKWFEFPKYKMLADERRLSDPGRSRESRAVDKPRR